jgi:hypothetical protein
MVIAVTLWTCSSYQLKHSDVGLPGIRKVDQYDNGQYLKTFYQKQDPDTGAWFEAEKGDDGKWRLTTKGKADRRDYKEFRRRDFP